jgi:hypothetical protein
MTRWLDRYPKMKDFYGRRGYGKYCGFGEMPAIAVIDFGLAWTDKTEESPMGADLDDAYDTAGSRDPEQAMNALLDMDLRWGDVLSTQKVIDYLKGIEQKQII